MKLWGFDSGIALFINETQALYTSSSYTWERNEAYFRIAFFLHPDDFLFPITTSLNVVLTFSEPFWTREKQEALLHNAPRENPDLRFYLSCDMQHFIQEILKPQNNEYLYEIKCSSTALEILASVLQHNVHTPQNCNACMLIEENGTLQYWEKAQKLILEKFRERLTIPEIAKEIGTNQCYLKRGFKMHFGDTIFNYILKLRMQEAKFLIAQNLGTPIAEIAESLGYGSLSSFSTAFKQFYGFSPQDLRRNR